MAIFERGTEREMIDYLNNETHIRKVDLIEKFGEGSIHYESDFFDVCSNGLIKPSITIFEYDCYCEFEGI